MGAFDRYEYLRGHNSAKMIKQEFNRIDPKRRNIVAHKKKQFAEPVYEKQEYRHRLNLYEIPPTADITLEDFEKWAIDRLRSSTYLWQ